LCSCVYCQSPTVIYALSLHDALPIFKGHGGRVGPRLVGDHGRARPLAPRLQLLYGGRPERIRGPDDDPPALLAEPVGQLADAGRSEEHTSELQSRENIVCRLLLEKKK